jgi:8-amino-7-oxononanoate synthase
MISVVSTVVLLSESGKIEGADYSAGRGDPPEAGRLPLLFAAPPTVGFRQTSGTRMPLHIERQTATTVTLEGRTFTIFAGCNYLGLAQHPAVIATLVEAAGRFGLSTGASRETTGNTVVHDQLERVIAKLVGKPDAVLLLDGFTANIAAAQVLSIGGPCFIIDDRAHRSLKDACAATGRTIELFQHRSAPAAAQVAAATPQQSVIATDSVFAADGAIAPLTDLLAAAPRGVVLLDDCHGLGVLGPGGRGGLAHAQANGLTAQESERVIITGTLAKALGCHGGFVAGAPEFCAAIRQHASIYRTTTPQPPAIAAAALEAVRVLQREPERLERLRRNTTHVREGLIRIGLNLLETTSPIFAFTLTTEGQNNRMALLEAALRDDGIIAPVLAYPDGPSARYFRLSVTSEHTEEQIEHLLKSLANRL